ncbi:unnamed protein product [Spodoptera exigua]|nr:unnamed protein product [Spodoptera exigua]
MNAKKQPPNTMNQENFTIFLFTLLVFFIIRCLSIFCNFTYISQILLLLRKLFRQTISIPLIPFTRTPNFSVESAYSDAKPFPQYVKKYTRQHVFMIQKQLL